MLHLNGEKLGSSKLLPKAPKYKHSELRQAAEKRLISDIRGAGKRARDLARNPETDFATWADMASEYVDLVVLLATAETFWSYEDGELGGMDKCLLHISQIRREWVEMVNLTTYDTARGSTPKLNHSPTTLPPSQATNGLKTHPQPSTLPLQASAGTLHSHHGISPPTSTSAANMAPKPCGMHGLHTPRPPRYPNDPRTTGNHGWNRRKTGFGWKIHSHPNPGAFGVIPTRYHCNCSGIMFGRVYSPFPNNSHGSFTAAEPKIELDIVNRHRTARLRLDTLCPNEV